MTYHANIASPLAGLGGVGSSLADVLEKRAERGRQKESLQEQRGYEEGLAESQRQRQANTFASIQEKRQNFPGELSPLDEFGILQEVLSETGDIESIKSYTGIMESALGKQGLTNAFEGKTEGELSDIFQNFGLSKEAADNNAALYMSLPTGGRTKFADRFLDEVHRSGLSQFGNIGGGKADIPTETNEAISQYNEQRDPREPFKFPKVNPFEGMSAKEKFDTKRELAKEGNIVYEKSSNTYKAALKANDSIKILQEINDRGKLPKGLERWNIDLKKGEIRIPAGANADTVRFNKTVNEFIKGAKEAFGARVTNFEIDRFMQQLPSLANNDEGRRVVLRQMELINQLQKLESGSLKDVYRKYGRGNIDNFQADEIAEQMRAPEEKAIRNELNNIYLENEYFTIRQNQPKGYITATINGETQYVPKEHREEVLKRKGRIHD